MTDHVRGSGDVELEMFGDFECPYCRDAAPAVARVLDRLTGRVRLRFRHFPITERHPHARRAAEAAESAGAQGAFWAMHDHLYAHQRELEDEHLVGYARDLGLDADRVADDLGSGRCAPVIDADHTEGLERGVTGTPAFFIDGQRYHGFYDVEGLVDALEDAGA